MYNRDIRILFVTLHCPFGASYGAKVRVLNIGRLLNRIGKVSLVIVRPFPVDEESLNRTRQEFDLKRIVYLNPNSLRNPVDRIRHRIRHELDPSYLKTEGIEACESDREAMLRMIDEYDVIWVHTLRVANALQIFRWPHTVIDIDDIRSRFYASVAKSEAAIFKRVLSYRRSFLWRRRERLLKKRFSLISVCSENDRQYLGGGHRIHVIPNGFSPPAKLLNHAPSFPARLGFIGSFLWMPNRVGVEWFIRDVWPLIKRDAPDIKLRLIGKGSNENYPSMGPDIDGLGYVEDITEEVATWSAMIVPVTVGGGTRVKIAEAFSRKCPIVSTTLGAFGYQVLNGEDLLIADKAQDFASACVLLLKNTELGSKISENAWKKFLKNWTWDSIGTSVSKAVRDCLSRSNYEQHFSIS